MRRPLLLATVLVVAVAPLASGAQTDELRLVPDWPASFDEARREPIRLLPGPPLADEAAHGAVEPGSSTAGTSYSFHWTLENPDGSPGPAGDVPLAPQRPVIVDVHLSAGPPEPPARAPIEGPDPPGLAPLVTVETALEIGQASFGPQRATHTLVSTPATEPVQRYRFTFDVDDTVLEAGEGLDAEVTVHQANRSGQTFTQPGWRIHTGEAHPSGLTLPLDRATDGEEDPLSLQASSQLPRETVRTGAYAALVASIAAAGWAAHRGYRELRDT